MKEFAEKFYKSKKWQRVRKLYYSKSGGLCERCLANGIYKPGKLVHHKTWLTPENINDDNITINPDNLELLCWECHEAEHEVSESARSSNRGNKQRFRVDEQGHVIIKPDKI